MAREKSEKLWIGGGVVATLLLAGGIWTFGVSPELDDAASIQSQSADTQTQNLTLESKVSDLRRQYAGIDKLRASLAAAHAALPSDLAMSTFTRQISDQAAATHVSVQALTAGAPAAISA